MSRSSPTWCSCSAQLLTVWTVAANAAGSGRVIRSRRGVAVAATDDPRRAGVGQARPIRRLPGDERHDHFVGAVVAPAGRSSRRSFHQHGLRLGAQVVAQQGAVVGLVQV